MRLYPIMLCEGVAVRGGEDSTVSTVAESISTDFKERIRAKIRVFQTFCKIATHTSVFEFYLKFALLGASLI